jgi:hypothetical protein
MVSNLSVSAECSHLLRHMYQLLDAQSSCNSIEQSPSWQVQKCSTVQYLSSSSVELKICCRVHKRSPHSSVSVKMHFNIILASTLRCPKWYLPFFVFGMKFFLWISLCMLHAPSTLFPLMCENYDASPFLVNTVTGLLCGRFAREIPLFVTAPWSLWDQKASYPVASGFFNLGKAAEIMHV